MAPPPEYIALLLTKLKELRETAGIPVTRLEERLLLGPGWIDCYESGTAVPDLQTLLALLTAIGVTLQELVTNVPFTATTVAVKRHLTAQQHGAVVILHFPYGAFDATYTLDNADIEQFKTVVTTLRDGLARLVTINVDPATVQQALHLELAEASEPEATAIEAPPTCETAPAQGTEAQLGQVEQIKADAVARAFMAAVQAWPQANPSDLWWFFISRAYYDAFNHPAAYARLDLGQSWKRTGGWALEEILVRHYATYLKRYNINLFIATTEQKRHFLGTAGITGTQLEADKADVLLTADTDDGEVFFGVVHVKASFAERRTDDVPMSAALVAHGFTSPLWTMDCKGSPSAMPRNNGELGVTLGPGRDRRSAKRKDIERDGLFSACFSYNRNTRPTPLNQQAKARVYICDFSDPDDMFSRFIRAGWLRRQRRRAAARRDPRSAGDR